MWIGQMVEAVLSELAISHKNEFHVVRLNGFIHTDDKLALKEIWRQLGREMEVEDDIVNKVRNQSVTFRNPVVRAVADVSRQTTTPTRLLRFLLCCPILPRYHRHK